MTLLLLQAKQSKKEAEATESAGESWWERREEKQEEGEGERKSSKGWKPKRDCREITAGTGEICPMTIHRGAAPKRRNQR